MQNGGTQELCSRIFYNVRFHVGFGFPPDGVADEFLHAHVVELSFILMNPLIFSISYWEFPSVEDNFAFNPPVFSSAISHNKS